MELWVHVSRLPMPHLDNDKWKHTMFTNKIYISVCCIDKISTGYRIYRVSNGIKMLINYNNSDRNDNNVRKNDKYAHSELYGSAQPAINVQLFSLRESGD